MKKRSLLSAIILSLFMMIAFAIPAFAAAPTVSATTTAEAWGAYGSYDMQVSIPVKNLTSKATLTSITMGGKSINGASISYNATTKLRYVGFTQAASTTFVGKVYTVKIVLKDNGSTYTLTTKMTVKGIGAEALSAVSVGGTNLLATFSKFTQYKMALVGTHPTISYSVKSGFSKQSITVDRGTDRLSYAKAGNLKAGDKVNLEFIKSSWAKGDCVTILVTAPTVATKYTADVWGSYGDYELDVSIPLSYVSSKVTIHSITMNGVKVSNASIVYSSATKKRYVDFVMHGSSNFCGKTYTLKMVLKDNGTYFGRTVTVTGKGIGAQVFSSIKIWSKDLLPVFSKNTSYKMSIAGYHPTISYTLKSGFTKFPMEVIRGGKSISYASAGKLRKGDQVLIVFKKADWAKADYVSILVQ